MNWIVGTATNALPRSKFASGISKPGSWYVSDIDDFSDKKAFIYYISPKRLGDNFRNA